MSNWSIDETLVFLEYYQNESLIWDPKDPVHKDRKKVADAWKRISDLMQKPVTELKSKKEILMTTFRKHLRKKQESIRSGAGAEDIYKPVWFAYEQMESFLLPVYTCHNTINTETQSQENAVSEETEIDPLSLEDSFMEPSPQTPCNQKSRRRSSNMAEEQMAHAFKELTNALVKNPNEVEDDCEIYAKLLAKKLRKLSEDERINVMYQIDGIFVNRVNQIPIIPHTPSPQYYFNPPTVSGFSKLNQPKFVKIKMPNSNSSFSSNNN